MPKNLPRKFTKFNKQYVNKSFKLIEENQNICFDSLMASRNIKRLSFSSKM